MVVSSRALEPRSLQDLLQTSVLILTRCMARACPISMWSHLHTVCCDNDIQELNTVPRYLKCSTYHRDAFCLLSCHLTPRMGPDYSAAPFSQAE